MVWFSLVSLLSYLTIKPKVPQELEEEGLAPLLKQTGSKPDDRRMDGKVLIYGALASIVGLCTLVATCAKLQELLEQPINLKLKLATAGLE